MPIVQIHLHIGRDDDRKRKLVEEVTKAICSSLKVEAEKVRIILSEIQPENFAIGGVLKKDAMQILNKKTDNEEKNNDK